MARGWISHENPLTFDPSNSHFKTNGLALFLCQVLIILSLCFILGNAFQRIGQPKVVGELLAGVVLGPTAFGNIPGFDKTIVPQNSLVLLKLTSNIGLVFFILLVGLETDTDLIKRYARQVALIALPGMAVPFAISVGLAKFVYEESTDQSKSFTTFFLFVSTVMAVTSLSILSRVVSELKLLNTVLGSVTIAAGALNDLIGYILLALGSALGSGGKQINALYQLLVALALFLVQWFVVRPAMFHLIRRSNFDMTPGAHSRVPNHLLVMTLLGSLISAFLTDACNLHPILGSLLFGIACPHGNFAIMITEGIETISVGILLPLYFVTSGLNADFTLLNTGAIWGQIFLIFAVVFISKFTATAVSTRIAGFSWREGAFVASLMQSKSIIELIILNAGEEIGVLSPQVYSMLFLTFIFSTLTVRPLAAFLYSTIDQDSKEDMLDDVTDVKEKAVKDADEDGARRDEKIKHPVAQRPPICLLAAIASDNPAVETLMVLLKTVGRQAGVQGDIISNSIQMDLMRFVPNDPSVSSILRMLQNRRDEQLDVLKMIAGMHNVELIKGKLASHAMPEMLIVNDGSDLVASAHKRLETIKRTLASSHGSATYDEDLGSAVLLVSWDTNANLAPAPGEQPSTSPFAKASTLAAQLFHRLYGFSVGVLVDSQFTLAGRHANFLRHSHEIAHTRERRLGLSTASRRKTRAFVPYFGGSDDRACVELAKRLATNDSIEAVIVSVKQTQLPADFVEKLEDELGHFGNDSQDNVDVTHGEINLQTLNVTQADIEESERRDARALFGLPSPANENDDVDGAGASAAEDGEYDETVEQLGNVTFVTLQQRFTESTRTKTHVEAVMTYVAPLLDARRGDLVLAGRGKLQQRTSDFRLQVEAIHRANKEERSVKKHASQADVRDAEFASMGRVLGACCEAALISHLSANIIVLQSSTAQRS